VQAGCKSPWKPDRNKGSASQTRVAFVLICSPPATQTTAWPKPVGPSPLAAPKSCAVLCCAVLCCAGQLAGGKQRGTKLPREEDPVDPSTPETDQDLGPLVLTMTSLWSVGSDKTKTQRGEWIACRIVNSLFKTVENRGENQRAIRE